MNTKTSNHVGISAIIVLNKWMGTNDEVIVDWYLVFIHPISNIGNSISLNH
jgi:hypothetical protein